MQRAPTVDGMFVGEPEDAALRSRASESGEQLRPSVPSLTWRRRRRDRAAHARRARSPASSAMPYPAWDLVPLKSLLAAAGQPAVRDRRDQPRLSVLVRFLRRADPPGPQVPRAQRQGAGRRDRARLPRVRHRLLLPLGRHRHAERQDVHRVLRRADRAQPADPLVRQCPRRQPDRSGVRRSGCASPAAGCWRWASSRSPKRSARTWSSGSSAQKIQAAFAQHARRRASGRSRSSSSAIRARRRRRSSRTIDYAIELESGLRELLSGGPYPGTALYEKVRTRRPAQPADEDWSRMEYSVLPARGQRSRRATW